MRKGGLENPLTCLFKQRCKVLREQGDFGAFCLSKKARSEIQSKPYRKPTQVGWTSSLRRAREGGLRNSANKLDVSSQDVLPRCAAPSYQLTTTNNQRNNSCCRLSVLCWWLSAVHLGSKLKFVSRLFIKNTGPCKGVSRSIRADACPVPVS